MRSLQLTSHYYYKKEYFMTSKQDFDSKSASETEIDYKTLYKE